MTWYFDASGTTMDVYDHTGTQVVTDHEFGGTWSGAFPEAVFDVMAQAAMDALDAADMEYAVRCVMDAAFEQIEEGVP